MLSRPLFFIACLLLLVLSSGCEQQRSDETVRLSGLTMGTTWSLVLLPGTEPVAAKALKQKLQGRLDQINRLMSTYDPDSEISRFNLSTEPGWFALSAESAEVIALSLAISRLTDGAFDITVGPLVELWGFGAGERSESIPAEALINSNLERVGYEKLVLRIDPAAIRKTHPHLQIDLSAVAKGYAVDQLAGILEQLKIADYLLEIGGELRMSGRRADGTPWQIAIEKPLEGAREVAAIFALSDTGLATSGNYRNFYTVDGQRYSHTIDPVSGKPVRHRLASVTVLDQSCARADALATALMVMGEKKARRFCEKQGVAAYFLVHDREDFASYASPAFDAFLAKVLQ